jgi:hypothetical protein
MVKVWLEEGRLEAEGEGLARNAALAGLGLRRELSPEGGGPGGNSQHF